MVIELRAQLSAAALDAIGDEAEQRRRAIEILKGALFRGRMIAKERLENGAGGVETARLLCGVTDEVVRCPLRLHHRPRLPRPQSHRGRAAGAAWRSAATAAAALAPFSDIDLLFVRPYKETAHIESVIEFMLYALWDLGFKVGHASRTVDECIKLSREDITIRTSILEARRLTGDEALAAELQRRFRDEVVKGTGAEFVAAKLKERDERHARAGRQPLPGRAQRQGGQGRPARPAHPVLDRPVPASRRRPRGGDAAGHVPGPRGARPSSAPSTSWGPCAPTCISPPAGRRSG